MKFVPENPPGRVLFLFVDGLGLAPDSEYNPVRPEFCPTLHRLLTSNARPLDPLLGIPGLPQSATGQTALFTGRNAPEILGKHVEGFPGPALRRIIEADNLFLRLERSGRSCRFANAYDCDTAAQVAARRRRSVTTTMALTRPSSLSFRANLLKEQALAHDLTRETRRASGRPSPPPISPRRAAIHLAGLAAEHPLTLFEYFLTDRAGHGCSVAKAGDILKTFDRFLAELVGRLERSGILLLLCSDHGNIEDMRTPRHTTNPVPLVVTGPGAESFPAPLASLVDVTPALAALFAPALRAPRL